MTQEEHHIVYHLKPKLDDSSGNGYIGVCLSSQLKQRIKSHTIAKGSCHKLYNYLGKRYYEAGALNLNEKRVVFRKCFCVCVIYSGKCSRHDVELMEKGYITEMETIHSNGLNIRTGNYRGHHNDETKVKISDSLKGRKMPEREKIKHRGFRHSDETKKKISEAIKGRKLSDGHKKKVSDASKKRWKDPDYRKRMKDAMKGKKWSDESRVRRVGNKHNKGLRYKNAVKLTLKFDF